MNAYEWLVAARYLRAKRSDGFISVISWLSLIGIMLGVATLIVVMSVMNGFREEMLSKILGISGHVVVWPERGQTSISNYGVAAKKAAEAVGDEAAFPPIAQVNTQMMLSHGGESVGAMVWGISRADMANLAPLAKGILEAGSLENVKRGELIAGYRLLSSLGAGAGDELTLTSPKGNITAFGTMPRMKTYRVGTGFKMGMSTYDSNLAFMELADLQFFMDMEGKASRIEIFLKDADKAASAAGRVRRALPLNGISTWKDSNAEFVSALNVERNVMFIILTLIILVASFNIISSLVMLVKDKARDIAVLKTLGMTSGGVARVFFIAGSMLGLMGTLVGVGLGILVARNIEWVRQALQMLFGMELFPDNVYFLAQMPSRIDSGEVAAVAAMSVAISFAATLYPSLKAARQQPVEVLRYE